MGQRGTYREAEGTRGFGATIMVAEGEHELVCELVLEPNAVSASVDGQVVAFIPLVDLKLAAGGFDADFIFVRGPSGYPSIATRDSGFEQALNERATRGPAALAREIEGLRERRKQQKSWKGFGVAFLASIFGLG